MRLKQDVRFRKQGETSVTAKITLLEIWTDTSFFPADLLHCNAASYEARKDPGEVCFFLENALPCVRGLPIQITGPSTFLRAILLKLEIASSIVQLPF